MRSTPITAACGIDVDIEPLGLRREETVIEMVERYIKMIQTEKIRGKETKTIEYNKIQQTK